MSSLYFEFGPFQFDAARQTLTRDGGTVQLKGKASELLQVLVERRGEILEKDQLMKLLWPDTVVEENNLTVHMTALRKALGDNPNEQRYIATIPGRGYRFVAEVHRPAAEQEIMLAERTRASVTIEEYVDDDERAIESVKAAIAEPPRRTSALPPFSRLRSPGLKRAAALSLILITLIGAAVYFWTTRKSHRTASRVGAKTIAVLPFKLLGADESEEYLGLGLTDALITRLGRLRQIIVRPTSVVRKYSGVQIDPVEAGQALKAEAVLEGSIQRAGDRVRVTVQLVNAQDGTHIWAEKFDHKFTDLFAFEDSISLRLAEALSLELSGGEKQSLARRGTENPLAYQLYLKGRFYAERLTQEGFQKSFEYLNQAIALDPNYAAAWDGLAYYHINTVDLIASPREAFPRAREAAERALANDETLAEAHISMGIIEWQYGWNWATAEREFKRAIELNPTLAFAHQYYWFFLSLMGRFEEGLSESMRGQELDPLTPMIATQVGQTYYYARQYDQSIARLREVADMDPNWWLGQVLVGRAYEQAGALDQAIAKYEQARRLDENIPEVLMDLGRAYAISGKTRQAETVLGDLRKQAEHGYAAPFQVAMVYAGLGDKDQALASLEKAYEARSWYVTWLKVEPALDSLRDDLRFKDLVRRVGF